MLALAAATALTAPRQARAQRSTGILAVSATILAVAPGALPPEVTVSRDRTGATQLDLRRSPSANRTTAFVRVVVPGERASERVFQAPPGEHERAMTVRIPAAPMGTPVRIERLITAGT